MLGMRTPINIDDFRTMAKRRLPHMVFDYLEGGAEDEFALTRNVDAFQDLQFLPRRLTDVSNRSTECHLWGRDFAMPVFIAPTGLNGILRPGADAMLARAAAKAGIPFALSTASNMTIEEIADQGDGEKWFQLYVLHQDIADAMTDRALAAGYEALILTVDVPVNGYRERDMRNGFAVPVTYAPRTIWDGLTHPRWTLDFMRHGVPEFRNFTTLQQVSDAAQEALMQREMDASLDFDALKRLREKWPKKLIVKGLCHPQDVLRCAQIGVDAVVLSNHGGRQLDGTVTSLSVLADSTAQTEMSVFMDGGVRRGADVLKALCLGATMVGLGRAALYAVAAQGEAGVIHCLSILKDQMSRAQAMLGAPQIADLSPALIAGARPVAEPQASTSLLRPVKGARPT